MSDLQITALCTQSNPIYHQLGIDYYDANRDARTFTGKGPVICHPPCRGWSAFMSHWAKPSPGEKDLALFCAEKVLLNGGVLEHPAHSNFFKKYKLQSNPKFKTIEIHQSWFNHPITKRTWLLMPGHYQIPELPFSLQQQGKEKAIFENQSKNQRSKTTLEFASWLIQLIKLNHPLVKTNQ